MIDILFVHPNASEVIYQGLAKNNAAIEPPIWAAMLANSVRSKGFRPEILDAEVEGLDYLSAAKRITEYKAKVVCFVVLQLKIKRVINTMYVIVFILKDFKL